MALTGGAFVRDRLHRLARPELDRAYRLAGLILGDRSEAQNAAQEALLRAWRAAASLRDPDGFQAWFDRILINVCRDRLRRRPKVRLVDLAAAGDHSKDADPFRSIHDRDEVIRAMATLDVDERLVVVLHYWADLTAEAIAARVGWPVGTVKSRLHRALAVIRSQMGSLDEAGERRG